jgi:predicted nucleic acid-binding protein
MELMLVECFWLIDVGCVFEYISLINLALKLQHQLIILIYLLCQQYEYEIYYGSNMDQDLYWNDFFNRIVSLPYNSESNRVTIRTESELRRKNNIIDKPDIMIAGTAIANDLKLATLNVRHFERINGLELIIRNQSSTRK